MARSAASERDAIALTGGLGAVAILLPLALALAGADYLAPRNLIADYVPLSAALAVAAERRAGRSRRQRCSPSRSAPLGSPR